MANKYAIDYKVTLKVFSTDLRTAKLKAENYIEHLPKSKDTVNEIFTYNWHAINPKVAESE